MREEFSGEAGLSLLFSSTALSDSVGGAAGPVIGELGAAGPARSRAPAGAAEDKKMNFHNYADEEHTAF